MRTSRSHYAAVFGVIVVTALLRLYVNAQQSDGVSLSPSVNSVAPGSTIDVNWSVSETAANPKDWIGVFPLKATNIYPIQYKYTGGATADALTFAAPSKAGTYEFRYFSNNTFTRLALSPSFEVTGLAISPTPSVSPGVSPTPSISPGASPSAQTVDVQPSANTVPAGGSISANWNGGEIVTKPRDWIGIYPVRATNIYPLQYKYTGGAKTGTLTFTAPNTGGDYNFRYFSDNSFTRTGMSPTFTVGQPGASTSPVPSTSPSAQPSASPSISPTPSTNPSVQPSPTVTPTPTPSVSASPSAISIGASPAMALTGQLVSVNWSMPFSLSTILDWVGVYRETDADTDFIDAKFTAFLGGKTVFIFYTPGRYNFRYFSNNSFDKKATSNVIEVVFPASTTGGVTNFPPTGNSIVAFGDSLTEGVGATEGNDYVSELSRLTGSSIINAGKSADSTTEALLRIDSDVTVKDPKIVIVMLGNNDVLRSVPQSTTLQNMRAIIDKIHQSGSVAVLVGVENDLLSDRLMEPYRLIAQEKGAVWAPGILRGILGNIFLMSDASHPNDAGYQLMAERLAPVLQNLIK